MSELTSRESLMYCVRQLVEMFVMLGGAVDDVESVLIEIKKEVK